MNPIQEKVAMCLKEIRKITDFVPEVALVLGSGLGALAEEIQIQETIPYEKISGFPLSTVEGHAGRFVLGTMGETKVIIMQGRVHYYEGYAMSDVVLPTRLMISMGAKIVFLTNASGGINSNFKPGDLMLIEDHISTFVPSPLIGPNVEEWGPRFPSMGEVYDQGLRDLILSVAKEENIPLQRGVYLQTTGPAYESPAEVSMLEKLGADVVGMSTTVEAIAACHMGAKVCGISCVTNMAGGSAKNPLSHQEVAEMADKAAPLFKRLVKRSIEEMKE